jgi:hypothetical protein
MMALRFQFFEANSSSNFWSWLLGLSLHLFIDHCLVDLGHQPTYLGLHLNLEHRYGEVRIGVFPLSYSPFFCAPKSCMGHTIG